MEILLIIVSAIFVNNIVLAQFLGICPYLGVSNKLSTATGMSAAVCFVITLATAVTYLLNKYLLLPRFYRILLDFHSSGSVFQIILLTYSLMRKLAFFSYRHKSFVHGICQWRSHQKSPCFRAGDQVKIKSGKLFCHTFYRQLKTLSVSK